MIWKKVLAKTVVLPLKRQTEWFGKNELKFYSFISMSYILDN
jgi:hypothetical protein